MTLRDAAGTPDPAEPRAALERVLARFAELELTPVAALELEFYLIDPARDAAGRPQPPLRSGEPARARRHRSVYGIEELDRYQTFLAALAEAAAIQRVPLTATSKEYAPGQFEANLRHQPNACDAADHAIFLKQVVKAAARAQGLEASFMAKPYPDAIGSGLHIHVSLLDESRPQCLRRRHARGFRAAAPCHRRAAGHDAGSRWRCSRPNCNSYRRFEPDMFAPVNRRWGINNRSAGLRVPVGPGEGRRVEHRVAGADANPYLALAAVLAGIHHGLVSKRDPGPPAIGNVSREPDTALPFTLDDALARLGGDTLNGYFGEETVSLYRETKRIEAQRLARIISPAEYDWYL